MIGKEADKAEKKERETIFCYTTPTAANWLPVTSAHALKRYKTKFLFGKKDDDAGLVFVSHKQEKDLGRKNWEFWNKFSSFFGWVVVWISFFFQMREILSVCEQTVKPWMY